MHSLASEANTSQERYAPSDQGLRGHLERIRIRCKRYQSCLTLDHQERLTFWARIEYVVNVMSLITQLRACVKRDQKHTNNQGDLFMYLLLALGILIVLIVLYANGIEDERKEYERLKRVHEEYASRYTKRKGPDQ